LEKPLLLAICFSKAQLFHIKKDSAQERRLEMFLEKEKRNNP
jgi:hypothetical protein